MTDEQQPKSRTRTRKRAAEKATAKKSQSSTDFRIAFLTPWRPPYRHPADKSFPYRERNFAWQQEQYARRGLPSFVADDGRTGTEPFSLARAVNRAAELPGPEYTHFLIFGADHALPTNAELADALHRASGLPDSPGWAAIWERTKFLGRPASLSVLERGTDPRSPDLILRTSVRACPGPTIVSREVFDRVGGFDERFEGWGGEDQVFRYRLEKLIGPGIRPPDPSASCYSLWHPNGTHRNRERQVHNLALRDQAYREIDEMVAERDRPEVTESDDD